MGHHVPFSLDPTVFANLLSREIGGAKLGSICSGESAAIVRAERFGVRDPESRRS